jgi:hypothetical protein
MAHWSGRSFGMDPGQVDSLSGRGLGSMCVPAWLFPEKYVCPRVVVPPRVVFPRVAFPVVPPSFF